MFTCNINTPVYVKLTEYGKNQMRNYYRKLDLDGFMREAEWDGTYKFMLWELMSVFGESLKMGFGEVPFENNEIIFVK